MKTKQWIIRKTMAVIAACPYTIVGRRLFSQKGPTERSCAQLTADQEIQIAQRVKLGRNIALIGVFCPFFWMALFSGATRDFILFNAIHSGIVIAIGCLILAKGRMDLKRYKESKKSILTQTGEVQAKRIK